MTTRTQRGRSPRGEGGSRPSRADRSAYSLPPSPVSHTARKTISPSFLSASCSTSRLSNRPDSRPIAMIAIPDPDNNEMNDRCDSRRDSARGGTGRRLTHNGNSHNYLEDADVSSPSCTDQRQQHEQQQHQQQHRGRDSSEDQDPPSAGRGGGLFDNSQSFRSQSMTIGGRRSRSIGKCDGRGNTRRPSHPSQCRHPSDKNEEDGRRRGSTSRTRRNVDDRHRRRSVSCPRGYIEKERRGSPTRRNDRQRSKSRPKSRPRPRPPPAPPRRLSLDYSVPSSRGDIVMSGISSDDEKVTHSRSRNNSSRDHDVRRRHDNARRKTHDSMSTSSTSINSSPHQHHQEQQQNQGQQRQQQKHQINLIIDANGHGQFHIKSSSSTPSQLTFKVQIDEASRRFLIHSSMGRLDKIRELHPGMNILRTLSHWNELQKRSRRLKVGDPDIRGGMLGIAPEQIKNSRGRTTKADMVKMTLMGEYAQHAWENDVVFQKELERFVEDALQFNFCLNGGGAGGDGGNEYCQVVGEIGEVGDGGGGGEIETAARKGNSGLLGRVLQKVIGD